MNVLLLTIGSAGDVHPFVGLGLALQKRGHRVKVITNPFFESLIRKNGLGFVPLETAEDFDLVRQNPDLWHPTKGFRTIAELICQGLRQTYDAVVNNYVPGETVVAASSLGLGARIAQDKHEIPMATVHLAPAVIRSIISPPKLPGIYMPNWLPHLFRRWVFAVGDTLAIDPLLAPSINALRAELNLPPVRGIFKDWWHSPQRVICLFPEWFAKPAADWPEQVRLTGFPMYDERGVAELRPELDQFLNDGPPPIAFTPGSAMWHADDILRESIAVCRKLNHRGLLLTGHAGHVPADLPKTVRWFSYAPFSQVLPRCAAVVHHGGIGTSAQAMAAGIRQVITPFSHDQFDNSKRMQDLGVAREVLPKHYRADAVAKILGELLADNAAAASVAEVARRFEGIDPVNRTCELLEALAITQ